MGTLERIDDLMDVDEAVARWPRFKRDELLGAMRAGDLRHIPKGRRRLVTEAWLIDYLRSQEIGGGQAPWPDESGETPDDLRSPGSGSAATKRAADGSEIGTTPEQEELGAELLAQSITKRPSRSSQP